MSFLTFHLIAIVIISLLSFILILIVIIGLKSFSVVQCAKLHFFYFFQFSNFPFSNFTFLSNFSVECVQFFLQIFNRQPLPLTYCCSTFLCLTENIWIQKYDRNMIANLCLTYCCSTFIWI